MNGRHPHGPGRRWSRVGLAALLLALAACGAGPEHTGDPALQASARFAPTPPLTGEADLQVVATDAGMPLSPGAEVVARTPGGEVSLALQDDGSWVGRVSFPEAGETPLELEMTTADGRRATQIIPVTVARRPGP